MPTRLDATVGEPTRGHARATDSHAWAHRYSRRLIVTDLITVSWAVIGTQLLWFGFDRAALVAGERAQATAIDYTAISVALIAAWMAALAASGTREARIVGAGTLEYKRIADAAFRLFGVVAIVAYLFQLELARGYILTGFPLGLVALLATRWIWRQWLNAERAHGRYSARAIVVGTPESATALALELGRTTSAGFRVVGACLIGSGGATTAPWDADIPVGVGVDSVNRLLSLADADTVIVASTDELPPARMRELSWSLEPGRHHLVVAPNLADIAGPRLHMRPVAGLPLLHVEMPRYEAAQRISKRAFDYFGALFLTLLLSPVLAGVALAVKVTSDGPILYRQQRIGRDGRPFDMLKFRSMRVNADSELEALLRAQGSGDTPLFKVQNDPRITRIGGYLRRFSLDELPQLFNVLRGEMSLVGPRPQREAEVALYDAVAARRLHVLPGLTGLWQVSGRSNLTWEQAIRLDLYYVENWSMTGDMIILWRTLRAVLRSEGAF